MRWRTSTRISAHCRVLGSPGKRPASAGQARHGASLTAKAPIPLFGARRLKPFMSVHFPHPFTCSSKHVQSVKSLFLDHYSRSTHMVFGLRLRSTKRRLRTSPGNTVPRLSAGSGSRRLRVEIRRWGGGAGRGGGESLMSSSAVQRSAQVERWVWNRRLPMVTERRGGGVRRYYELEACSAQCPR